MALYNNEISIVIATYNGVLFIEEQIESIARGTLLPNEIIIVDDRSTDNTVLLLNNIKRNHPELNIKIIINDSNIGAHSTFKKAIKLAKGKYIAPCDQDDIWEKNHIEILYNEIKKNNCDLVFGQDRIMYEDGEILHPIIQYHGIEKIIFGNNIPGHLQMFHKDCVEVYDVAPEVTFDWGSVLYAISNKGIKSVNNVICTWRRHENVVTSAYTKNCNKYKKVEKNKYYKTFATIVKLLKGIKSEAIEKTMNNNFKILSKYSTNNNVIKKFATVCDYVSRQNVISLFCGAFIYAKNLDSSKLTFKKKIGFFLYSFCYPFVWWYDYHTHSSL